MERGRDDETQALQVEEGKSPLGLLRRVRLFDEQLGDRGMPGFARPAVLGVILILIILVARNPAQVKHPFRNVEREHTHEN